MPGAAAEMLASRSVQQLVVRAWRGAHSSLAAADRTSTSGEDRKRQAIRVLMTASNGRDGDDGWTAGRRGTDGSWEAAMPLIF